VPADQPPVRRVAVVGGGLAGLTAAYLLGEDPTLDILVLEGSPTLGGKLRLGEVAGVTVDVGAEAMLNRRPEGVELARELGLEVVHPTAVGSRVWTRGALRPLPRSLMGVPLDLDALARSGILSDEGMARVRREPELPPVHLDGDISVRDLVAGRFGDEVVDRLVEPLLGGVYAGQARLLSARAATPQLVTLAERGGSLLESAHTLPTSDAPVFAGLPGGMGRLPRALADTGRFNVRTNATVRELRPVQGGQGFELIIGETRSPETVRADAVVLATPAAPTARLLRDTAPAAATELAAVDYASTAVVTFAFRADDVEHHLRDSSGFLVPPVDGRRIKASTFSFAKWDWVREAGRDDLLVLRTSLGRYGEERTLQVPDDELVASSLADLADATGLRADPVDSHVQRWGGGLPQYAVGHLDRTERVRAVVAEIPGLAVCGAAYDGVGIPAVIASARRAAIQVAATVGDARTA
jgi:oxygen-dependent protoporphyrinogen oxidase